MRRGIACHRPVEGLLDPLWARPEAQEVAGSKGQEFLLAESLRHVARSVLDFGLWNRPCRFHHV